MLEISMLGGFAVHVGGREVRFSNRKTSALLACLALGEGAAMQRERLVGLLWSETDENRARASLRQALHELKEALRQAGHVGFQADKLQARLERGSFTVDIVEAIAAAERGEVHEAIIARPNPVDDMLSALESVDSAFRSWIMSRRRSVEEQLVSRFEKLLEQAGLSDRERETVARALIHLDPTHEIAVRHLMSARLGRGDISGALNAYKSLWDLLDAEYETEPSRQTQELFAAIKMAEEGVIPLLPAQAGAENAASALQPAALAAPVAQRPVVTPGRLLISIAAFGCAGLHPDRHYLVQGFRTDLMSSLVKFREWLVRDASRGQAPQMLGLDEYVLEASAFENAGEIRLSLMLRDEQSGIYLWSEKLTITSALWQENQQTIVRRLAAVLNLHLSNSRLSALAQPGRGDALAFDRWLRAQGNLITFDAENMERARGTFQQLTIEMPGFAPAFSAMAQLLNSSNFARFGVRRTPEDVADAIHFGSEAIRLDPVDSRAHLALGWAYAMAGRHDRAAVHHDLARELNESDPWVLMSAGLGAASRGEHALAAELSARALQLCVTPLPAHWLYVAQIAYLRGDYVACSDVDPLAWSGVPYAAGWRIAALGNLGRSAEAKSEFAAYVERLSASWQGKEAPGPEAVARWFLSLFPFAHRKDWLRLRHGFVEAGARLAEDRADPAAA